MHRLNIRGSLLGTCAVAALMLGVSNGAQAQINGGGSTLAGPVYNTIFTNLTSSGLVTYTFAYGSVGSGAGARGVLCNDQSQDKFPNPPAVTIDFGASDNPLTSAQINAWNSNSPQGSCTVQNGGIALGGPLLQIPTIGTPITIIYNNPNQTANGGLTFTDAQLCGIFSGNITSWTDAALSGITRRNAPSGPITVVYRSDGSGTSALLTAHLATVCPTAVLSTGSAALPAGFNFTSNTQTFASQFTNAVSNATGFTVAESGGRTATFAFGVGSSGVAAAVGLDAAQTGSTATGTSGSIGYISPDYTQIAPVNSGGQFPPVAKVVNSHSGVAVLPDNSDTLAALNQACLPGDAGCPLLANVGTDYVPVKQDPTLGYPIVGFTTWILPVCFQDNNVIDGIYTFFGQITSVPNYLGIIDGQGFVPLPGRLVTLLNANIFGNNNNYNIDVGEPNICQLQPDNSIVATNPYVGR